MRLISSRHKRNGSTPSTNDVELPQEVSEESTAYTYSGGPADADVLAAVQTDDAPEGVPAVANGASAPPPAAEEAAHAGPEGGGAAGHAQRLPSNVRLTLSIERGVARVVAFSKGRVVAWGTASLGANPFLDPDEEAGGQPPDAADRKDSLQGLLEHMGVRKGAVIADLPLHAPLMRYLHVTKAQKSHFEQMITAEVLETLPFAADEIDFIWGARKVGDGKEVSAVVVSKPTVDKQARMLKGVGLRPAGFYSKAMALTYLAGAADSIVVCVNQLDAIIVLVQQGAPRYVHQVSLATASGEGPSERASRLAAGVEQVVERHTSDNPGLDVASFPVMLAGQAATDEALTAALRLEIPRDVRPCEPQGLRYPEHFPIEEYGINLGLALTDASRGKKWTKHAGLIPPLDLLPLRHRGRPFPTKLVGAYMALLVLGAAAFGATGYIGTLSVIAERLTENQETLERNVRLERLAAAQVNTLSQQAEAATELAERLTAQLAAGGERLAAQLTQIATVTDAALPPGVALGNVNFQSDSIAISAGAVTYEAGLDYTANLRASGLFSGVRLQQIAAPGGAPSDSEAPLEDPEDPDGAGPLGEDPDGTDEDGGIAGATGSTDAVNMTITATILAATSTDDTSEGE